MNTYHKIQTVFKRDPQTKSKTLLQGEYSLPEFEYLKDNEWVFTEKLDGTNIRLIFNPENGITLGGKTDNAQIPSELVNYMKYYFTEYESLFMSTFDCPVCLYGEGYGAKIQKGGGNYSKTQKFVLFDIKIGDWWLQRKDVLEIANKLSLDIVPIIGYGSLIEMVDKVRDGFNSRWGDFQAEGIVARPSTELKTRSGERIITKLKCKDFKNI